MTQQGKYITGEITSSTGMGIATAICFSEVVEHIAVSEVFSEIWGAGFFVVTDGVEAYGKSVGLGVISRGVADTLLIKRALGLAPK